MRKVRDHTNGGDDGQIGDFPLRRHTQPRSLSGAGFLVAETTTGSYETWAYILAASVVPTSRELRGSSGFGGDVDSAADKIYRVRAWLRLKCRGILSAPENPGECAELARLTTWAHAGATH